MGTVVSAFCGPTREKKKPESTVQAPPEAPQPKTQVVAPAQAPAPAPAPAPPPAGKMPEPNGTKPSTTDEELDASRLTIKEPLALFQKWFEEAQYSDGIHLATSMTLATASKAGRPSSRIVGVKGFDKSGFKIATNKNSRKAKDMDENPFASLMFYWESMNRMVRIDGPVEKLDLKATCDIWKGFPRAAQLTHSASKQDDVLPDKATLVQKKAELTQQYADSTPIPPNPEWCAYNLIPDWWEFYQVTTDLPDRIIFRKPEAGEAPDGKALHQGDEGWFLERVYP